MDTRSRKVLPYRSQFCALTRSSILFLHRKFISPINTDEDDKRREFILNIILCSAIGVLFILDIIIVFDSLTEGKNFHGIPIPIFSLILIFFAGLLFLSRKGLFKLASYGLITFFFLGATYGMYRWGVGMQMAILTYVLIIIISSILVSTRFSFWTTLILSLCGIILSHLELNSIINPDWYWTLNPEHQLAEHISLMFFLIMVISWLSNREIEKSLERARRSERLLREERDQLEITVEKRTKELRQAEAEKMSQLYRFAEFGRLSSGLFHDLINPLNSVAMNINELAARVKIGTTKKPVDPNLLQEADRINETRSYLEKAVSATKRMHSFITAIQKQIKTSDIKEIFSSNEEIEQAIDLLQYKARKILVSLSFTADEDIPIYGNPIKFGQIITNLISNTIDSYDDQNTRPPEGTDRDVTIKLSRQNDTIKLTVIDHGCGIPTYIAHKIFDPFFTTKPHSKGTGLGLSTVKSAVENDFNGTISLSSTPSEGTTFTISIPINIVPKIKDTKKI